MSDKNNSENKTSTPIEPAVPASPIPTVADDGPPAAPSNEYVPVPLGVWPTSELPPEEPAEAVAVIDKPEIAVPPPKSLHTRLRVYDSRDVLDLIPDNIDWIVEGILARKTLTVLSGEPKGGKSTWTADMIWHISSALPFLGMRCEPVRVLILSEESWITLRLKYGWCIDNRTDGVLMATRPENAAATWTEILKDVDELLTEYNKTQDIKIGLLVVDSLSNWMGLSDENNSAEMLKALRPLRALAEAHNLAVLGLHHRNKSGETQAWRNMRGSTALAQEFDVLIDFARVNVGTDRWLSIQSRLPAPLRMDCSLKGGRFEKGGRYVLLEAPKKEKDANVPETAKKSVSDALTTAFLIGTEYTMDDLVDIAKSVTHDAALAKSEIYKFLEHDNKMKNINGGVKNKDVIVSDTGKSGHPYRYKWVPNAPKKADVVVVQPDSGTGTGGSG
jgi:hypothetical protein